MGKYISAKLMVTLLLAGISRSAFAGENPAAPEQPVPAGQAEAGASPGTGSQGASPAAGASDARTPAAQPQTAGRPARNSFPTGYQPVPLFSAPYPAEARGDGPRAGPYMNFRWAEDWSGLRSAGRDRKDYFDPLKYIPLFGEGSTYITLSGEHRTRLNYTTNPDLREAQPRDQWLIRNIVGADLHVGPHFRAFGELNSSIAFGAPGVDASPMQKNDLIVQQLFAEVQLPVGKAQLSVRAGRQYFMDGPPNVLHVRFAPNVYTSMDGVRLAVSSSRARASLFDFRGVRWGRGAFDDPTDDGEKFRGISSSFVLPSLRIGGAATKLFFDPFYWNHRLATQRWGGVTARDDRDYYGARLWGSAGNAAVDITLIGQSGHFGNRRVSAQGLFANASYLLKDVPLRPRIGLRLDYTSGGGAYGSGKLKDFQFFYGSIPYFTWGNLIGPTNLFDVAASVRLAPLPRLTVGADISNLRRSNERDAVYTFTGAPYAGTPLVRGHDIGRLLRTDISWQLNPHIIASIKTDFLFAGKVLRRANLQSTSFLGTEIYFRF